MPQQQTPPQQTPSQQDSIQRLSAGCQALGLQLGQTQLARLLHHLQLLHKWNRRFNLTAIPPAAAIGYHLLDSLAVLPYLNRARILDIGSGGGFPGIPLAVAAPERQFVLLDCRRKRVEFLRYVVAELGLANVQLVCSRVENYQPLQAFDTLVARAFAPLQRLLELSASLHPRGCRVLAMQGKGAPAEWQNRPDQPTQARRVALSVPQVDAARHLCIIDF